MHSELEVTFKNDISVEICKVFLEASMPFYDLKHTIFPSGPTKERKRERERERERENRCIHGTNKGIISIS